MTGAVISLCDRTGNMVKPWAEAGHECWCFDMQHSIRKPRREGNINYVWADIRTVRRPVSGPIAIVFGFFPCTHVTNSDARDFLTKGGGLLRDTIELHDACKLIGEWSGAPYCIENPVGVLSSIPHIGKPQHYFHPADYTAFELGDHYTKKTGLWTGNGFVMPPKAVAPQLADTKPDDRIHKATPSDDRGDIRSVTPMGFARAVFQANAPIRTQQAA